MKKSIRKQGNERGITLIALVITVIILILLASVVINFLLGNNGLITKASETKFKTELSSINESLTLEIMDKSSDKTFNKNSISGKLSILTNVANSLIQKYENSVIIQNGELVYCDDNKQEIKWCEELGIRTEHFVQETELLEAVIGTNKKAAIENNYLVRYQYPYQITGNLKSQIENKLGRPIDYSIDRFYEVNESNVLGESASGKQYIYQPTSGVAIEITEPTNRTIGSWLWYSSNSPEYVFMLTHENARNKLFEVLAFYHINQIYISLSINDIIGNNNLKSFVSSAYKNDVKVYLLIGNDNFLDEGVMDTYIDQIYNNLETYNQQANYNERIAGISYDAEVWLNSDYDWKNNIESRNRHIDFIERAQQYADSKNLELHLTIPFWLVQYDVDEGNMFDKVTQIVDRINMMVYRDTAEDINSLVIEQQSGAPDTIMNYAIKNQCALDIAIETIESSEGDRVSFYEEESAHLGTINTELNKIAEEYKTIYDGFVFSIHHAYQLVLFHGGIDTSTALEIATPQELADFINNADRDYAGETIQLLNDIDMTGYSIQPFNAEIEFAGTFDGKGHSIKGLTINTNTDYVGLFAGISEDGVIKNLNIVDSTIISTGSRVGAIAGKNSGTIINCSNQNTTVEGNKYVGGLIGRNYGHIQNCFNTGNITCTQYYVGGIAGINSADAMIYNVYNTGMMTEEGNDGSCGAIVGDCTGNTVENAYWLTGVTTKGSGYHNDLIVTTEMSEADMKGSSFVDTLNANITNSEWKRWKIENGINSGYPIFE